MFEWRPVRGYSKDYIRIISTEGNAANAQEIKASVEEDNNFERHVADNRKGLEILRW